MKYIASILIFLIQSLGLVAQDQAALTGAWKTQVPEGTIVMICSEKFFAATVYDQTTGAFKGTCGGTYRVEGKTFREVHEFNTMKADLIGKESVTKIEIDSDRLVFIEPSGKQEWTRIDRGEPGALAGAWLITGRMEGEAMNKITPGARRTMKILSGKRFQWIAYNVDSKEFFGTGGGTYTTENGKYVETIEFFSRDNSRVGKSLSFDFSIDASGNWRHKGVSSKGEPLDEVWTRRENVGI